MTVGGTNGAATLQTGWRRDERDGEYVINAGTLRISKANISNAIPVASTLSVANQRRRESGICGVVAGDAGEQYHGRYESGGADADVVVDEWRGGERQVSTFTCSGLIVQLGHQCAECHGAGGYGAG